MALKDVSREPVVTREALLSRPVDVRESAAFGEVSQAWVRELGLSERRNKVDFYARGHAEELGLRIDQVQQLATAYVCTLDGPDPSTAGLLLDREADTLEECLQAIAELPVGWIAQLNADVRAVNADDLEARPDDGQAKTVDRDGIWAASQRNPVVFVPGAFGALGGCWVRSFREMRALSGYYEAATDAAGRFDRFEFDLAVVCDCALLTADGQKLVNGADDPLLDKLKAGWVRRLSLVAQDLSGYNTGTLKALGVESPFRGSSSASGASTVADASQAN